MKTSPKTFLVALTLVSAFATSALGLETAPYKYNPRSARCVNGQGLQGMRPGFKGSCGDLWGADLQGSDLEGSDLTGANLSRANLKNAKLSGANLSGAHMLLTQIQGADLSGAIYNERTVLPFARSEAEKRGMIYKPTSDKARQLLLQLEQGKTL